MSNPNPSPSRSDTANGRRYRNSNARVRIAGCNGLPIAFRRVVSIGQPGSFATQQWEAVTPKGVTSLSGADAQRLHDAATVPLN